MNLTIDPGFAYEADLNRSFAPKKVWIQTYGCQMNYSDTERLLSHLHNFNYSKAKSKEEADLILFNTCAIRDHANQKFYSHLGEMVHLKKRNPGLKIGVTGCVAQIESKELKKRYPHMDFVLGTDALDSLPDILSKINGEQNIKEKLEDIEWRTDIDYSIETRITHNSPQAFINVTKGCNNFCSYCIVPYTRGREKSRSLEEVCQDAKRLVEDKGIQEITLLGQNVNSFGKDKGETFAELLYRLNDIENLKIIRYTTSHPYDMSDALIKAHTDLDKLANHVHLPVQSGSNTVLKRMNRKYTREHYLNLVRKLKNANPNLVISTDIIAGFPNETEKEHQDTLKLLEEDEFDFIYAYAFSPRPGTIASKIEDVLDNKIRKKRLHEIQNLQLEIQNHIRQNLIGKRFEILVEGKGKLQKQLNWKGRTSCMRIVHFTPENTDEDYLWKWVSVEITSATALSCQGRLY